MMKDVGSPAGASIPKCESYDMLGIPLDLYTRIFAVSRISGWTAHILEQDADNKLIHPRAEYFRPRNVPYVPIDET